MTRRGYDPQPAFGLEPGRIGTGAEALAATLARQRVVILDGYGGVLWEELRGALAAAFERSGVNVHWQPVADALRPARQIEELVAPFLGGNDPLFGTRFTGRLREFFDTSALAALQPDPQAQVSIIYGSGAALAKWAGFLAYVDVSKNVVQYRSRSGEIGNLGSDEPAPPKEMYKRFYFVDWVALNRHKAELTSRIDLLVDGRQTAEPSFVTGDDLRRALDGMGTSFVRAVPWFEPGPWGGQWLKRLIPELPQDVPNYAWSFELITPENSIALESGGQRLEVSFDFLMFHAGEALLGRHRERFGDEFPIRFDYLDTVEGGNLSLQCHPGSEYIRRQFGESFTQDETYYIVDLAPSAQVYLGFREGIEPAEFRAALEESARSGQALDVGRFVRALPAEKHDLFLIPNRTIHCSGAGNMVLEISATPYIFTFKLYDWQRLGLDGQPRPLNIERAFENLDFGRAGGRVDEELIATPRVLEQGDGWRTVHLPTHAEHFYDVHRLEFARQVEATTRGGPHVLNLVEGGPILLRCGGREQRFHFAETFIVPAAAGSYRLLNEGAGQAKLVKAFLKE